VKSDASTDSLISARLLTRAFINIS